MGKIKVKRKSTLIDMTAMSDVTVLLLTFFMLTSTFLQKEPTQVVTPPSVSTEKIQLSNVAQILVATGEDTEVPKVFISITGEADPAIPEEDKAAGLYPGMWGSEPLRETVLKNAVQLYKEEIGKDPGITQDDLAKFSKIATFGVPMEDLHEFLSLSTEKQDEWVGNMNNPQAGIPLKYYKSRKNGEQVNEFQIWMKAIRDAGNPALTEAMRRTGEGIAVKADRTTPFHTVNLILEDLRSIKLNKFTVMTALKSENE